MLREESFRERLGRQIGSGETAARVRPRSALAELPPGIVERLSPSLAERLARLRPARGLRPPARSDRRQTLLERVGGELLAPDLIRVEQRLPLPWTHGSTRVRAPEALSREARARLGVAGDVAIDDLLFFDTETTGLAGGTGTVAFVVGLARFETRHLLLTQYLLLGFAAEECMLRTAATLIAPARQLVSYNGKSFDAPLLRTRYRLHRASDPLAEKAHLDLLPWMRRARPREWPDARLATVEERLFGVRRERDVAGGDIPLAWRAWLQGADDAALGDVMRHNRVDLLSLVAVFRAAVEHRPSDLFGHGELL